MPAVETILDPPVIYILTIPRCFYSDLSKLCLFVFLLLLCLPSLYLVHASPRDASPRDASPRDASPRDHMSRV